GFGVGIGAATVVYLIYGVLDSPAKTTPWSQWTHLSAPLSELPPSPQDLLPAIGECLNSAIDSIDTRTVEDSDLLQDINARVVLVSEYIFFALVPSMEKEPLDPTGATEFLVLDLMAAHRTETNAARCIARCACELVLNMRTLVIYGLVRDGGLHADFVRAEVPLAFDAEEKICITRRWEAHLERSVAWSTSTSRYLGRPYLGMNPVDHDLSDLDTIFVLDGEICLVNPMANREAPAPRLSLRDLLRYIPQETKFTGHARASRKMWSTYAARRESAWF
ncbi:hypothetical protein C8J57DRAFT_1558574, partial [Mycena rebaudengoi]